MNFAITCAAGLESIVKKEIEIAGYKVLGHAPTLVRFSGDQTAIAKINLRSRVGNKLFLELGKQKISDFDGLFDLVSTIDWPMYVQGNPIIVTAASKSSLLTSTPAIQSIVKKSIVKKILANRHCERSEAIQGKLPGDFSSLHSSKGQIRESLNDCHFEGSEKSPNHKSKQGDFSSLHSSKGQVRESLNDCHFEGNEKSPNHKSSQGDFSSLHSSKGQVNEGVLFEDQKLQPIEIFVHIENNECSILLNTTGESMHKRGYKKATGDAPINESLAAGLLLLSGWKFGEPLYDLFCGSGTIAIEAALLAKNIAPGMFRSFAFQHFARYDQTLFTTELQAAKAKMMLEKNHTIIASDTDPQMIEIAKENAQNAGVEQYISFAVKDVKEYLVTSDELCGTLVSNPPYGLRMNSYDLISLYRTITQLFSKHPKLHGGIISSYEDFLPAMVGTPDAISGTWKKSVLYNGGEKCWFYKKTLMQ